MIVETMTQTEALDIIHSEAKSMGLGILETMYWMAENYEELGSVEKCAYRTAFRGFEKLLQPAK